MQVQLLPMHLNHFEHSAKINVLSSSTQYRICVIGLGNRLSSAMAIYTSNVNENSINDVGDEMRTDESRISEFYENDDFDAYHLNENKSNAIYWEFKNSLMKTKIDTPISKCIEARTLESAPIQISDENRLTDRGLIHSLLTRRLGLIVGCCLGIFVFIVIIVVLGWLKLKKRRLENAKRQEQHQQQQHQLNYQHRNHPNLNQTHVPPPPDYNTSYRQLNTAPYTDDMNYDGYNQLPHPNCISGTVMGTTTLTC